MPRCDTIHPLQIFLALWYINDQEIISPVKILTWEQTFVCPSNQVRLHRNKVPGKNILRLGWGVHDLAYPPVYVEVKEGLHRIILNTYILDVLCNVTPHYWHEMTQFRAKLFRHAQLFSPVILHEHSMYFCITICDVPFTLLFPNQDKIMGKRRNICLSRFKVHIYIYINWINGTARFIKVFWIVTSNPIQTTIIIEQKYWQLCYNYS